jgi:hypothetical protein
MTSVGKPRLERKGWSQCRWTRGQTLGWRSFRVLAETGVYSDGVVVVVATQCRFEMDLIRSLPPNHTRSSVENGIVHSNRSCVIGRSDCNCSSGPSRQL